MTPDELRTAMCVDTTGPLKFPVSFVPDDEEELTVDDASELDRLRAENEALQKRVATQEGVIEGNLAVLASVWKAVNERDRLQALAGELAAALKSLAWRHSWIPQGGPCVCDQHRAAEDALARADAILTPKETPK